MDDIGVGIRSNELLVLESSSGQRNANGSKMADGIAKQVSTMVDMLKTIAGDHLDANYQRLLQTKPYGIQFIKATLVLSEVTYEETEYDVIKRYAQLKCPSNMTNETDGCCKNV